MAGSATFKEAERVAIYAEEVLMKQSVSDSGWTPYYQPEIRNPKGHFQHRRRMMTKH